MGTFLPAAIGDNEVGGHADEEPEREQPEAQLAMPEAAHGVPELADEVEDRAAGDGVAEQLHRRGADVVAPQRAEERRPPGHKPRDDHPAPRWLDVSKR